MIDENNLLRNEIQEKEDLLRELTESNDELSKCLSELGRQIEVLKAQLNSSEQERCLKYTQFN